LIETAVIVDSLEEALSCAARAYAVTRRPRKISKKLLTPAQAVAEITSCAGERTALVFGSEKLGLSGKDIALCGSLIQISSSEASPSLNLAQAVAVVLYEMRRDGVPGTGEAKEEKEEPPAGIRERLILYRQMEETLQLSGFFKSANPASVMGRLSGIIERANPDAKEIKTLLGAFREMKRAVTGK
jgi:TrmH family RNA methyltransferase